MNYLVTGGTGFLGSNITKLLLDGGDTVFLLVHKFKDLKMLGLADYPNLHLVQGDITDKTNLLSIAKEQKVPKIDYVVHCANVVSFDKAERDILYKINVEGTENLLQVALRRKVKRFLYVSSVNALGFPEEGEVCDENTPYDFGKYNIPYMDTKYLAEQKVLEYTRKGLDCVIVNPGTVFGVGDIHKHSGEYIINIYNGVLKFYTQGGFTQCIAKNVADGIQKALKYGKNGQRYILGGFNLSYKEFLDIVSDVLDRARPKIKIPNLFLPIAIYGLYLFNVLWKKLPKITPSVLIQIASKYLFYSSQKAIEQLHYNPGTIEDFKKAIKEQFLFYKQNELL